jgi:hypothetical protein
MRWVAFLGVFLAATGSPAGAQWVWDDSLREGQIKPVMSYPAGNPDAIGRLAWNAMRSRAHKEKVCELLGCFVVVNESLTYRLKEFYVRPIKPKSASDWGENQLDRPLGNKEVLVRFKLPDARFCEWPVRFVLRRDKTKELVPIETTASLCAAPHRHTVLRLRIQRPVVEVGKE